MISSLRRWLKKLKDKYTIFSLLYNKVYVSFLTWKRHNVKLYKWGEGNLIKIPSKTYCDNLVIIIKGNNNRLKIGEKCIFKNTNEIFIEGNDNKVVIGDNVTFIGDGTVVGLNSMVFGTVPNNSIAVGIPAKIVKSNICWTE